MKGYRFEVLRHVKLREVFLNLLGGEVVAVVVEVVLDLAPVAVAEPFSLHPYFCRAVISIRSLKMFHPASVMARLRLGLT